MSLRRRRLRRRGDRYTPFGGAKGGIDCDPYDPDADGVLRRYVAAMRPFLERHWATGEDLGVRQDELDEAAPSAGLRSSIDAALLRLDDPAAGLARLRAAFAVDADGIGLGDSSVATASPRPRWRRWPGLHRARRGARRRPGLRIDGRGDRALPRARRRARGRASPTATGSSPIPPGSTSSSCCSHATATARSTAPRWSARRAAAGRGLARARRRAARTGGDFLRDRSR